MFYVFSNFAVIYVISKCAVVSTAVIWFLCRFNKLWSHLIFSCASVGFTKMSDGKRELFSFPGGNIEPVLDWSLTL